MGSKAQSTNACYYTTRRKIVLDLLGTLDLFGTFCCCELPNAHKDRIPQ